MQGQESRGEECVIYEKSRPFGFAISTDAMEASILCRVNFKQIIRRFFGSLDVPSLAHYFPGMSHRPDHQGVPTGQYFRIQQRLLSRSPMGIELLPHWLEH